MPELDIFTVCHTLNIDSNGKPLKQIKMHFYPKMEKKIKNDVEK